MHKANLIWVAALGALALDLALSLAKKFNVNIPGVNS